MTTTIEVSLAHVYGYDYSYGEDSSFVPGDWPSVRQGFPTADDRIEVWVGPVPDLVVDAHGLRLAHWVAAATRYASPSLGGISDVDQSIRDNAARVPPVKELMEGFGFWITLRAVRRYEIADELIVSDRQFAWLDDETMLDLTDSFPIDISSAMESTAGAVLDLFPGPYRRVHMTRPMFETQGRSPTFDHSDQIGGIKLALRQAPDNFPRADLDAALENMSVPKGNTERQILHWMIALTDETDPWKRFVWAIAGLEIVAQALSKRFKEDLTTKLEYRQAGTTDLSPIIKELLWPADSDRGRREDRSVVFHFAVSALGAYPSGALDDLAHFKDLWADRGKIAHGGGRATMAPPATQAEALFRRYAAAFLQAEPPRRT